MAATSLRAPRSDRYTVQSGDCLANIARNQYGDEKLWSLLAHTNRISNPNLLFIGQSLKLPSLDTKPFPSFGKSFGSGGGRAPATAVVAPAYTFNFPDNHPRVVRTGLLTITLKLKASITIQKKDTLKAFTVKNLHSIEASYRNEATTAANSLYNDLGVDFDLKTRKLTMNFAAVANIKTPGGGNLVVTTKVISPTKIQFSCTQQPIKGDYKGFAFEGKFGFDVTVEGEELRRLQPAPVYIYDWRPVSPNWNRVAVFFIGALVLVAVVVYFASGAGFVTAGLAAGATAFLTMLNQVGESSKFPERNL